MELAKFKERAESLKKQPTRKRGITNERQYVLKQFLDRLNLDRKPPYKPLTPARLGTMLRFVETSAMKQFYDECKDAKNFSKYFWWSFKK